MSPQRSAPLWLSLVTAAVACLAAPAAAPAQAVRVSVVAILATDQNANVDKRLECVAREVQKREPTLTGFRLARCTCKSLPVGEKEEFPLADGQCACVRIDHGADKDNWVGLTVKPPLLGEVSYDVVCGKYFPIVTRYVTKDRERLILAVMVRPCNKGK